MSYGFWAIIVITVEYQYILLTWGYGNHTLHISVRTETSLLLSGILLGRIVQSSDACDWIRDFLVKEVLFLSNCHSHDANQLSHQIQTSSSVCFEGRFDTGCVFGIWPKIVSSQ